MANTEAVTFLKDNMTNDDCIAFMMKYTTMEHLAQLIEHNKEDLPVVLIKALHYIKDEHKRKLYVWTHLLDARKAVGILLEAVDGIAGLPTHTRKRRRETTRHLH